MEHFKKAEKFKSYFKNGTKNDNEVGYVEREDFINQEVDKKNAKENVVDNNEIEKYGKINEIKVEKNNPKGNIYYLNIIGQIEGHMQLSENTKTTKYEHVIPQLVGVSQDKTIDGVLIILNTVGGDVEAGLAISELIANIGKPTVSLILGGAHSIGIPLAVSTSHSFIAESATMIIHPVRLNGTVTGSPQTYEYFNKIQERIVRFIESHSNIKEKRINELMFDTTKLLSDVGSLLIGEEAVKEKIINDIGGLNDAVNKLYELIDVDRKNKKRETK